MKTKTIFAMLFGLLLFNVFVTAAKANLIIDPAKLGILRLHLYPFSPAVSIREFDVGNTYNVPMQIELEAVEDMEGLITFSEQNFTLQANETRTIEYTVSIDEPGYYSGAVLVKAALSDAGSIGYNAELSVFVYESNLEPYFYVVVIAIIVAVVVAFVFFFRRSTRRKKGRRHAI